MTSAAGRADMLSVEVLSGAGSSAGRGVEQPHGGQSVLRRQVRVAQRHGERLVPHQLLHTPQVEVDDPLCQRQGKTGGTRRVAR